MKKADAEQIVSAIQDGTCPDIVIETMEQRGGTQSYQVLCRYEGPTFRRGQQLFLQGMSFWITNPYEWSMLCKILNEK